MIAQRTDNRPVPRSAFPAPTSAFQLPRSAFQLPRSAFQLPRSAFQLPRSAFQLPRSAFQLPRSAFSLVELLIVIAVIVILIALLLPAVGMVRGKSRQSQCTSNQRQLWHAWSTAMSRDPVKPVRPANWLPRLSPYIEGSGAVRFCPDDVPLPAVSSFGINAHAGRMLGGDGARIVFLDYRKPVAQVVDQTMAQLDAAWPADHAPRHFQALNVAHYDGHVEPRAAAAIDPRVCVLFERYWRPLADSRIALAGCLAGDPAAPAAAAGATTGATGTTTGSGTTTGGTTTGSTTTGGTTTGGTTTGGTTTGGMGGCATGRFVKITLPGTNYLSLAEVQVFDVHGNNYATGKTATQSSTFGAASLANDGNTNGAWGGGSVSHTNADAGAWWQVDLGADTSISRIVVWNRTDCCGDRLSFATVAILDAGGSQVWSTTLPDMNGVSTIDLDVCGNPPVVCGPPPALPAGYVNGLKGEYRGPQAAPNMSFSGAPNWVQVDSNINFPVAVDDPLGTCYDCGTSQNFTVIWAGQIWFDRKETYTFWITHDDISTLLVNGVQIYQGTSWGATPQMSAPHSAQCSPSGSDYGWVDIVVMYGDGGGPDRLVLEWESPSTPRAVVPSNRLRTVAP